jgi:hypothetical protein
VVVEEVSTKLRHDAKRDDDRAYAEDEKNFEQVVWQAANQID